MHLSPEIISLRWRVLRWYLSAHVPPETCAPRVPPRLDCGLIKPDSLSSARLPVGMILPMLMWDHSCLQTGDGEELFGRCEKYTLGSQAISSASYLLLPELLFRATKVVCLRRNGSGLVALGADKTRVFSVVGLPWSDANIPQLELPGFQTWCLSLQEFRTSLPNQGKVPVGQFLRLE